MTLAEVAFCILSPAAPFAFAGLVWVAFGGLSDWKENRAERARRRA